MNRIPFSQVLKNASVDIEEEYHRLFFLFFFRKTDEFSNYTIYKLCSEKFLDLPFRGTCITLEDFNQNYDQNYVEYPSDMSVDYLVSFCEYSYNLAIFSRNSRGPIYIEETDQLIQLYIEQVRRVIEKIGYSDRFEDGITIFVPRDQASISVSEIIGDDLSYRVIEYNHHSMKGQLSKKKETILALASKIEPDRNKLKQINASLETDLFFLLNNINLRHNNIDSDGKNYNSIVANMSNDEMEQWYDKTYQVLLLAFLELDHIDRKEEINKLKEQIQR